MIPSSADWPSVIVFGECLVDRFIDATRTPDKGFPQELAIPGGAPFNVARHLAGLDFDPLFITRLGADAAGAQLQRELQRCGVRPDGIQWDARNPTGEVRVRLAAGSHAFEILDDQAYDHIDAAALPRLAATPAVRWLYFGTLIQRAQRSRAALAALRERVAHRAFVDLNWRAGQVPPAVALDALDHADCLKLSAEELALLLSWSGLHSDHAALPPPRGTVCTGIGALLAGRRTAQLIVTCGAHGYALWNAAGTCMARGDGLPMEALVDTVGAGDAFSSIVLAGLLRNWPMALTLERANAFAAAICGVRGAVPPEPDFYQTWKNQWQSA